MVVRKSLSDANGKVPDDHAPSRVASVMSNQGAEECYLLDLSSLERSKNVTSSTPYTIALPLFSSPSEASAWASCASCASLLYEGDGDV